MKTRNHRDWITALLVILAFVTQAAPPLTNKTLVAWVTVDDLEQCGGSVLTIEKPRSVFDGIIFGEISPRKWMVGSDGFNRTQKEQEQVPVETADRDSLLQITVVYAG